MLMLVLLKTVWFKERLKQLVVMIKPTTQSHVYERYSKLKSWSSALYLSVVLVKLYLITRPDPLEIQKVQNRF